MTLWSKHAVTCTVICRAHGRAKRTAVKVAAEYYRIVDGALIFRNARPGNYPQTVRVFAPGYWLEVIPHV